MIEVYSCRFPSPRIEAARPATAAQVTNPPRRGRSGLLTTGPLNAPRVPPSVGELVLQKASIRVAGCVICQYLMPDLMPDPNGA